MSQCAACWKSEGKLFNIQFNKKTHKVCKRCKDIIQGKITDKNKEIDFLKEFAQLLKKYDADLEVSDDNIDCYFSLKDRFSTFLCDHGFSFNKITFNNVNERIKILEGQDSEKEIRDQKNRLIKNLEKS